MQGKIETENGTQVKRKNELLKLILRAVGMAMGIAAAVLCFQAQIMHNQVDVNSIGGMLGIGLACLGISLLPQGDN